ncbi:MAG: nuclear transport factor 2 family protein [Candidatus Riflebacteria bacterium]|nr:nuclear transport factor 2 family protein [Candidatus Riflebacteria bacterium]
MVKIAIIAVLMLFLNSSSASSQPNNAVLQNYIDELQIKQVVDDIDNTCDAKDWAKCRKYFLDEIDVDFTSLAGGSPSHIKADELISGWNKGLYKDKLSHHMRTNHQIEVNGDSAEVFSKGYALNILQIKNGSDLWEVWGDYHHSLKRTEKGWKVSYMKFSVVYARGNEKVREYIPEGEKK